jgi:putative acetyltransferase
MQIYLPGCAWEDTNLGKFYQVYQNEKSKYWVVENNNKIVAGCGIGPLTNAENICEVQRMYSLK